MKKKQILILGVAAIAIIIIVLLIIFGLNKKTIIDIKIRDNGDQNSIYILNIKKNGEYSLTTKTKVSEESEDITEVTYNEKLTDLELEKVNKIIDYVKEQTDKKDKSLFEYDYEKESGYSEQILGILENLAIAIENISLKEIEIGDTTRRSYGNTMLDNIISTQL